MTDGDTGHGTCLRVRASTGAVSPPQPQGVQAPRAQLVTPNSFSLLYVAPHLTQLLQDPRDEQQAWLSDTSLCHSLHTAHRDHSEACQLSGLHTSWNAWKTSSVSVRAGQWYLTWAAGGTTAPRGAEHTPPPHLLRDGGMDGWTPKPLPQSAAVVSRDGAVGFFCYTQAEQALLLSLPSQPHHRRKGK